MSDITNVFPNKAQFDTMNIMLAAIAKNTGGMKIEKYADIQNVVRLGLAGSLFSIGDQLEVNKTTAITAAASGTGITAASVDFQTFLNKLGTVPAGVYAFVRASGTWTYEGKTVVLSQYGITTTGNAADGDTINVTVTGKTLVFDVLAADGYDHPAAGNLTHALSLGMHACSENVIFDATEALCYCADGMAAGTYHFTLLAGYDTAYGGGKTLQFTTTQAIPAGGVIVFPWAYNTQSTDTKISTYISRVATEALESNLVVTEGTGGTDLGTADGSTENMNHTHRIRYGSNNWNESAFRQWANSTAASGWWKPQTKFDRPSSSSAAGFLYGVDPDFVAVLGAVKKRTAKNTVTDGGGYADTEETVFLLSQTEVNLGTNNSVYETPVDGDTAETTPYPYYVGATNADRIKYLDGSASSWWLRGPTTGYAYTERFVTLDGSLTGSYAYYAYGAAPGLCII